MSRKRKENFSEYDKSLLLALVRPNKELLETKKNDIKTLQSRATVWDFILDTYNADSGVSVQRTVHKLKELYKRLKIEAKKQFTEYNKQVKRTGGGDKPSSPDKISKAVFDLIPQDFTSYDNPYDDDNESTSSLTFNCDQESGGFYRSDELDTEASSGVSKSVSPTPSCSSEISRKVTPSCSPHTEINPAKSHSQVKKKIQGSSAEECMKAYAKEEHDLRMQYLREKRAAKLELIEIKKRNELLKSELLTRKNSQFEQCNVPPLGNVYQNL